MEIQFYGANCISLNFKPLRIVVDDNLAELGKKSILKDDDVALFTSDIGNITRKNSKLTIDCPGEFEVGDVSVIGIPARAHTDEPQQHSAVMYKITAGDVTTLITGHVYPEFSEAQLEAIGLPDVVVIPVGGHGYTLDPQGAMTIIKEIEPKIVIPTNYSIKGISYPIPQLQLDEVLKELSMDTPETLPKLKLKSSDLGDTTKLIVLDAS